MNQNSYKQDCVDLGMSRKLSEGCRWDSVHAMHAGFCDWQKGGRKYKQLNLKSEAGLLGMSTEVKGCRRDWNYGKSSKPVSAGKNSRTFGLRGQHLKPCDKGLCPFFSSSKPYTSNCTCGEESTQLPVQLQALCQWHHTVPVAWVPPGRADGDSAPSLRTHHHDSARGVCDALCTPRSRLVASQAGIWVVAMEKSVAKCTNKCDKCSGG